jgi:hypothetical protein
MYLSYSGFKRYKQCPRAYWHQYVNKTVVLKPDNRVNMLYGAAVGRLFEVFYNERLWTETGAEEDLLLRIPSVLEQVMSEESRNGVFNWKDPSLSRECRSLDLVRRAVEETVPRGLISIRRHRLLGVDSRAEVKLDSSFGPHQIGGRADFLIRRLPPDEDVVLLDGKGSKWRESYVDPMQLQWYALLYQARTGKLPDRLGFLYWREEPDKSLDWVPVSVDGLLKTILETVSEIERGKFHPRVSPECSRCSYLPSCPEGTSIPSPITGVEDIGF